MPTSPGLLERSVCWIEPTSSRCIEMQEARQARDRDALLHTAEQALDQQAALNAQLQLDQTVRQARMEQIVPVLAVGIPVLLLVVGGAWYYLRSKREQLPPPEEDWAQ